MFSDLQEIFGTLAVGTITMLGGLSIIWCFSPKLMDLLQQTYNQCRAKGILKAIAPILAMLLYTSGFIVQDVTDRLLDRNYEPMFSVKCWPPKLQREILGSETNHRFNSLFIQKDNVLKIKGLGIEIFKNNYLLNKVNSNLLSKTVAKEREIILPKLKSMKIYDSKSFSNEEILVIKSLILDIYYLAKNWAYKQDTYFSELKETQKRVDFTRSICLVSTWLILALLIVTGLTFIIKRMSRKNDSCALRNIKFHPYRTCVLILLLSFCAWAGREGYVNSEHNFNERVFGYYSSHHCESAHAAVNSNLTIIPPIAKRITIYETNDLSNVANKAIELAYKYGPKRTLTVFDLDMTLMKLTTELGSDPWFDWQKKLAVGDPNKIGASFDDLLHTQAIIYHLGEMVLMQHNVTTLITKIQNIGIYSCILTARGPNMQLSTHCELFKTGISFRDSAVGPLGGFLFKYIPYTKKITLGIDKDELKKYRLREPRYVSYRDGVYMVAGQHKGAMLRLLLGKTYNDPHGLGEIAAIVVTDDKMKNCMDIREAFLNKPVDIWIYRYGKGDADVQNFKSDKAKHQWDIVAPSLHILSSVFSKTYAPPK